MSTVTIDRTSKNRRRRAALVAAALLALVLPSCGSDSSTLPDVFAAVIQVTVDPNPIIGTQNLLTGSVSATYKITHRASSPASGARSSSSAPRSSTPPPARRSP